MILKTKKILLLNPPGDKIYVRDYYCSKISKGNYIYEPPDLVQISGWLYEAKYDIKVIDAIASKIPTKKCAQMIKKFSPDVIIFITGSVSYQLDFPFLKSIKRRLQNTLFVGSGDLFMESGEKRLKDNSWLDAIMLDFSTDDILKYLRGEKPEQMIYRKNQEIIVDKKDTRKFIVEDIPLPRHEFFPLKDYKYPFVKKPLFATVLTDYGCPFNCNFCIMSQIGFKLRSTNNVLKELRYLKEMGITELYFDDQTFGVHKKRTIELLNAMIEENLGMGWVCFSRVDVVDKELLTLMQKAGCHTIMFGVESGSQKLLNKHQKGLQLTKIKDIFDLCQKLKIRTLATYLFGLPGETKETAKQTIKFSKYLNSDFAAFNMTVPRMGTKLRRDSVENGTIDNNLDSFDQSSNKAYMETEELNGKQIGYYKNLAVITYYFRPRYLIKRLTSIRSWQDVKINLRGLLGIVENLFNL